MKRRFTDAEIVFMLETNDEWQHSRAITDLYEAHGPLLMRLIRDWGGLREDGEEILGSALLALYENVRRGRFSLDAKLSTYLTGVAKNIWLKQLRQKSIRSGSWYSIDDPLLASQLADIPESEENKDRFWELVAYLHEKCQAILKAFVAGYTMKEIAQQLDLGNADNAKAHKYECLRKLGKIQAKLP